MKKISFVFTFCVLLMASSPAWAGESDRARPGAAERAWTALEEFGQRLIDLLWGSPSLAPASAPAGSGGGSSGGGPLAGTGGSGDSSDPTGPDLGVDIPPGG